MQKPRQDNTKLNAGLTEIAPGDFEQVWDKSLPDGTKIVTNATGLSVTSNREINVSGGEATATWLESEDVTRIFYELDGAVGDSAFITFDAPDAATQTANLANAGTASSPAQRELIYVGHVYEKTFPKDRPLRQFGATRNGGTGAVISITAGK